MLSELVERSAPMQVNAPNPAASRSAVSTSGWRARCILLLTKAELSMRHSHNFVNMRGKQIHSKEPLEFLIHDLKHMEYYWLLQQSISLAGQYEHTSLQGLLSRPGGFLSAHLQSRPGTL